MKTDIEVRFFEVRFYRIGIAKIKCKTGSDETTAPVLYFTTLSSGNLAIVAYIRLRSMVLRTNLSIGLPLSDTHKT